ncbi:MAG TPA: tetratricopeptide repeat protein, partial [Terriglobales bacterium]
MGAPAEVDREKAIGASFPYFFQQTMRDILALVLILVCSVGVEAQRATHSRNNTKQISAPSPFLEAEGLLSQGSIAEARAKIQEQLQLNPSSVEGYNLLGIAYSNEHDFDNALEAFQHALRLSPNSTKTLNNLGNLYAAQEKFDLAEKNFRKALNIEPANNDSNYNLGLVLMAKGSAAEAIPHFQHVHPANVPT